MITLKVNNFPTFFADGMITEPLFLKPNGTRMRYPIGWHGKGRYEAGTLRVWKDGARLIPGVDYLEEANGLFFTFSTPPGAGEDYREYLVGFVPRAADLAIANGADEMFLFPNWMGSTWIGDGFWIGRHLASKADATDASEGSSTTPTSRRGVVPWCSVDYNAAVVAVTGKGAGWHLVRNREWANIALWCAHHDIFPTGNSVSGVDGMGVAHAPDPIVSGRALTSTGPVTSSHNLMPDGIFDLVGNAFEWIDGLQLVNNVIYTASADGTMTSRGTTGSFGSSANPFSATRSDMPEELYPAASGDAWRGADGFWFTITDTQQAIRGGDWSYGPLGGLGALILGSARSDSSTGIGFRPALSLTV